MANQQHLAKLQQGQQIWNQWRENNPDIKPNFVGAELYGTNLIYANLKNANFTNAKLCGCKFLKADLKNANFTNANLMNADVREATLNNANLMNSMCINANFTDSNLTGISLVSANCIEANFERANLTNANLSGVLFKKAKVLDTNFSGAILTGACIDDWHINSKTNFQNVKCDYIYLEGFYEVQTGKCFLHRIPHDRDKIFTLGEFTRRYTKILESVELYFNDGIDWQVFLRSFQKLQKEKKLKIKSGDDILPIVQAIENKDNGAFVIRVGVSLSTDKEKWEKSFWEKYQLILENKEEQIKFYREELTVKRQENTKLMEIIHVMAEQENSNFNFYDSSITGGVSGTNHGIQFGGDIHNYAAVEQQLLIETATEIQKALTKLQESNGVTLEFAQQQTAKDLAIQAKNDPKFKDKLIKLSKFVTENGSKTLISEGVKGVLGLILLML